MASNFIPMLSSSPPPIDEADSFDDDEDDFGMFASSQNAFDDSFPVPCNSVNLKPDFPEQTELTTKIETEENTNSYHRPFQKIEMHSVDSTKLSSEYYHEYISSACDSNGCEKARTKDSNELGDQTNHQAPNYDPKLIDSVATCEGEKGNAKDSSNISQNCTENVSSHESIHMRDQNAIEQNCTKELNCSIVHVTDNQNLNSETEFSKNISTCMPQFIDVESEAAEDTVPVAVVSDGHSTEENYLEPENDSDYGNAETILNSELPDLDLGPFSNEGNDKISVNDDDFEDLQCLEVQGGSNHNPSSFEISADERDFQISDDSEAESFGNFECVNEQSHDETFESETDVKSFSKGPSCEGFADFESHLSDKGSWVNSENKSDDFADFETAAFSGDTTDINDKAQTSPAADSSKGGEKNIEKISKLIGVIFAVTEDMKTNEEFETSYEILDHCCKSRRLWDKLHDSDQTLGIPFQWGVSHSFQQLLHSVNIDYHSILRTSTVPFFASGLGLLEPTRGQVNSSNETQSNSDSQILENSIPPVQFDWGSSGLINPLDSGQAMSTLMDLTFLNSGTAPGSNSAKDFNFENELLSHNSANVSSKINQRTHILEQLLSSSVATMNLDLNQGVRPPGLSAEAGHVLDQLPNLSFMMAKVLMFPVSDSP